MIEGGDYKVGQWAAFDQVLNWINTQDKKFIDKSKLYAAVMEMRPISNILIHACQNDPKFNEYKYDLWKDNEKR